MLKILSGIYRQRRLLTPSTELRPTAGIVRAAAFNICQGALKGARCLDLCAGSGAVGFEALSRGAAYVEFVESDAKACRCISQNIKELEVEASSALLRSDAMAAVELLVRRGVLFDIIYIDPPYDAIHRHHGTAELLSSALLYAIDRLPLLAPHGWLFVETAAPPPVWKPVEKLTSISSRRYGSTTLHLFRG